MPVLPSLAVRDGSYYQFWVYILTSRTGTLYVGVTGYLGARIMQHKIDSIECFTKKYKVRRLVYYESYEQVMTAIRREKQLKGWRRDKKITLIEKVNPRWVDLAENWGGKCGFGDSPSRERLESAWRGKNSRDASTPPRSPSASSGSFGVAQHDRGKL